MKNHYDCSFLLQNLQKCPFHDRVYELICTSQSCTKSRLGCTKCFYDKTHKECKSSTILIEDICDQKFNESLESWLPNENSRKKLEKINEIFPGDLSLFFEEISLEITKKFEKMQGILMKKLEVLEKEIKEKIRAKIVKNSTMNLYKDHFLLKSLLELIAKNSEKSENNQEIQDFFNFSLEDFLKKFDEEKELIYFNKENYLWKRNLVLILYLEYLFLAMCSFWSFIH